MTTAVNGAGRSGGANHSCRTDRRTHRMSDSYVVTVIGSRAGGGTLVRQLARVADDLVERMGMPPAETEAAHGW